jgi:hypothetical protein
MRRRRLVLLFAAIAAFLVWRRTAGSGRHVDVLYEDGSLLRLERGVEAEELLRDADELLAALA